jgi:hypothetical protein
LHIDSNRVQGSEIPQSFGIVPCIRLAASEKGKVVFFSQILQLGKGGYWNLSKPASLFAATFFSIGHSPDDELLG